MKLQEALLVRYLSFFISACSDSSENKGGEDHVWKEQIATPDKAKAVEGILKSWQKSRKKL